MNDSFQIKGARVELNDLLELQALTSDLQKLNSLSSHAKMAGEQRSRFRGNGREFIEMKHYQSGDDVRQIDWRLTAKKQAPYVRVMEEDRHSEHVIWLKLNSQLYFGTHRCLKSVMACHRAAFLIWRFVHLKHPVRLHIQLGQRIFKTLKITNSLYAAEACKSIADAHQALAETYRHPLEAEPTDLPTWQGSPTLWMLSDFLSDDVDQLKQALSFHAVSALNCLQTLDAFDVSLPDKGRLPVKFKQQQAHISTSDATFNQQYQRLQKHRVAELEALCWQHRGQFHSHQNDQFQWQEVQQWPLYH
jgi:uncharacterized protein (DUF58 family)